MQFKPLSSRFIRHSAGLSTLSAVLAVSPLTAHAAQAEGQAAEKRPAAVLELTSEQCRRLSRHVPDPGVSYQPGVDVRGRSVAPADLTDSGSHAAIEPPETIVIPIEVDLFNRFGIPANPALFEGDAQVGEVLYKDGKLYFNGQRLADGASDEIALYCRDLIEARGRR